MIKPDHKDRSYVTVKDKRTGKSKCVTVYGLRPEQVIEAIRIGIDSIRSDPRSPNPDTRSDAA